MTKSFTESFTPRGFELLVELRAEGQKRVEADFAPEVEVRDRLLRLGQARGNDLAHPVELDFLELAVGV